MIKDIPFYPDPTYKPPPKPVRIPMSKNPEIQIVVQNLLLILRKIPHFRNNNFNNNNNNN